MNDPCKKETTLNKTKVVRYSTMIFLPIFIIFTVILITLYNISIENEYDSYKSNEKSITKLVKEITTRRIDTIKTDLRFLSNLTSFHDFLDSQNKPSLERLQSDFLKFSKDKKYSDQVRYLDKAGMEVVRVNYNNNKPSVVSKNKLQNKKDMYYFKEGISLTKGKSYISKLDLNIENSKIEISKNKMTAKNIWRYAKNNSYVKPVIRFGLPIFKNKEKMGLLLINYFASPLLNSFDHNKRSFIVNDEGYWLKGFNKSDEWSFIKEYSKKEIKFKDRFPLEWQKIKLKESGQIYTKNGLFTFDRIKGLKVIIISYVPSELLESKSSSLFITIIILLVLISLIIIAFIWLFIFDQKKSNRFLEEKKRSDREMRIINEKLENYSYTISHDLKEPVRSIRSFSEFLSEDYKDVIDDEGKHYLSRILESSSKMASMIDDLLMLYRVGAYDIKFKETDISKIILEVESVLSLRSEVTEMLALEEDKTSVVISAKDMPSIICQSEWMKVVFFNLISNSIKFSNNDKKIIDIKYEEAKYCHKFSIQDNGYGIDEEYWEKIFELFRKAHQNKSIKGSGAGLTIVKAVITEHNGSIWVESSERNKGTLIKFTIDKKLS